MLVAAQKGMKVFLFVSSDITQPRRQGTETILVTDV